MKISCKVATAIKSGVWRIPKPKFGLEECRGGIDNIDFGDVVRSLDVDGVTHGSKDLPAVYTVANEFLFRLNEAVEKYLATTEDSFEKEDDANRFVRGVEKCYEKLDSDRCCYTTIIADSVGGTDGTKKHVRFRVGLGNPKSLAGKVEDVNRRIAVYAVRILLHMKENFSRLAGVLLDVGEWRGGEGLIEEAKNLNDFCVRRDEAIEAQKVLKEKRSCCPHYCAGFCSSLEDGTPPDFKCQLYCSGKCAEPTLPSEFSET